MQTRLTVAELSAFLDEVFPQVCGDSVIEAAGDMTARLRVPVAERHLRPGGTVSGPTMFMAADLAFYVAVLAMIGREPLTVTTGLTINFLRKPGMVDLIAEARILKLGRSLAVGDVLIFSDGDARPVAHASVTYAIPPRGAESTSADAADGSEVVSQIKWRSKNLGEDSNKKVCPECGHVFRGNGWDGIDAHWRAKHEHVMPYEEAWPLLKEGRYQSRN